MISKIVLLLALVLFVAAFLGDTLFGHAGVELLGGGLALFAGAELLEDTLNG